MTDYDSTADTLAHIDMVQQALEVFTSRLQLRGQVHDASKLAEPEKSVFDRMTLKLRELTYDSDAYKAALVEMGEGLQHHYAHNSHHPEHWPNGVAGMSLLDLVEMFADWKAAGMRHADGDFAVSLEKNRKRFGISEQLAQIFENTRNELSW